MSITTSLVALNFDKTRTRAEGDEDEGGEGDKGGERFVEDS